MLPQRENLSIPSTFFLFSCPFLTMVVTLLFLPLRILGGGGCKSSWVDVTVFIGIGTNINGSSGGRVDGVNIYVGGMTDGVLNSDPSGVVKEASKCSERGSTYGVIGTKVGLKR